MMKMNIGAWIGIGAGIAGFLIGIYAVLTSAGKEGIYIAAGMTVFFVGMGWLFYKVLFGPMMNVSRLQKTGIPATATIVDVRDTGVTVNDNPQVKLVLEVKNSFGQRYTATCRTIVSRINPGAYQKGMQVAVLIDPKNEQNVVINFNKNVVQENAGVTMNEEQFKSELEQLQVNNDSLLASGRPARAIVKKYNWLGAYVNGNNPYVELEMEVLPENGPSFSGKAKGVIHENSIHKYQPGSEVFVKYDFYDNSKLVIDHTRQKA